MHRRSPPRRAPAGQPDQPRSGSPAPAVPGRCTGAARSWRAAPLEDKQRKRNRRTSWRNNKGGRPISGSSRPTGGDKAIAGKKQYFRRKKLCRFCVDKIDDINYKDVRLLSSFISERGKITPRRISGVCAPHQRRLAESIKQARNIALVPFATSI